MFVHFIVFVHLHIIVFTSVVALHLVVYSICCSFIFISSLCALGLLVIVRSFSCLQLFCTQLFMFNFTNLRSNFVLDIPNLVGKICLHCSIRKWNQISLQEQQHSYTSFRLYYFYLAIFLYLLVVLMHSPSHEHESPNLLHMKFCFNECELI